MDRTNLLALACLVALAAGCGDDEPDAPPVPVAPGAGAQPPGADPGGAPPAAADGRTSVRTPAPAPATGCPATDVAAQLERAGTVHDRQIHGEETLDLAGSPHRFPQGILIGEAVTLRAEPCALAIMGAGTSLTVGPGGALIVEGEADKPVRFDSEAPAPAPGQWNGIRLHDNARPQTKLVHAIVEDAGSDHLGAAIAAGGELALNVQHVTIRHSKQHGVRFSHEARFTDDSTALTVTESGREDPYSAPVWFSSASQVRTLPEGTYTGNAYDEIYVDRGDVRSTGTWRNPGVRYRLNRGIDVASPNGAILTIAPGATLAFNHQTAFAVGFLRDGGVVLDGESEETPITLTSARPHPAPGDWVGLRFGETRADAVIKVNHVVVEHAGGEARHPHNATERLACRDTGAAAIGIRARDLGPRITHTAIRSLPPEVTAILLVYRGDATDYTAAAHANDFAQAGTECAQNLQPAGDCPAPACRPSS
jgi:hypothetical protein